MQYKMSEIVYYRLVISIDLLLTITANCNKGCIDQS